MYRVSRITKSGASAGYYTDSRQTAVAAVRQALRDGRRALVYEGEELVGGVQSAPEVFGADTPDDGELHAWFEGESL